MSRSLSVLLVLLAVALAGCVQELANRPPPEAPDLDFDGLGSGIRGDQHEFDLPAGTTRVHYCIDPSGESLTLSIGPRAPGALHHYPGQVEDAQCRVLRSLVDDPEWFARVAVEGEPAFYMLRLWFR